MKKISFLFFLLFVTSKTFAQEPADIWYFGYHAGIDFSNGAPFALEDGEINTIEGCTSICNDKGELLFYASGNKVYNKNHALMDNGTGLNGHWSSTQSILTVPFLDDPNKFYLFTLDTPDKNTAASYPNVNPEPRRFPSWNNDGEEDDGYNNGFNYSVVDMTANGGLGKVIVKNIPLVTHDENDPEQVAYKGGEKLTGIINYNNNTYWILTHFVNRFYAFKVDKNGVDPNPVVSETGPNLPLVGYEYNGIGEMKFSPKGHKIAMANQSHSSVYEKKEGDVYLFDFDAETGKVSNPNKILEGDHPYGVEFSPDGSKLYISVQAYESFDAWIYQFDLSKSNIGSSYTRFHSVLGAGGLQLGPDGNIYKAQPNNNSLGRISNPNRSYYEGQYEFYAVNLSPTLFFFSESKFSLPNYIQSYFEQAITMESTCSYEKDFRLINYTNVASVAWDFGDSKAGQNNFSSQLKPAHQYAQAGEYKVTATVTSTTGLVRTVHKTFSITDPPIAHALPDIYACEKKNTGYSGYSNTISTGQLETEVLQGQTGMLVTYYRNGDFIPKPLPDPYQNYYSNHEEWTVRVARKNNPECYSETKFDIFIGEGFDNLTFEDLNGCYEKSQDVFTFDFNPIINELEKDPDLSFWFTDLNANTIEPDADGIFSTNITGPQEVNLYLKKKGFNCEQTSRFQLLPDEGPQMQELNAIVGCDDNGDGISEYFDVSGVAASVLQNQSGLEITYFGSNGNEITNFSTPYTNLQPFQEVITVRLTNLETGCYAETPLLLKTSAAPQLSTPPAQYTCDEGAGIGSFNTTDWVQQIIGNQTGLKISWYDANGNPLASPLPAVYRNTVAHTETLSVKVEDEQNPLCSSETQLELVVTPKQEVDLEESYSICGLEPFLELQLNESFDTWEWRTEDGKVISTGSKVLLEEQGIYSLRVGTIKNGIVCEEVRSFEVLRSTLPKIREVNHRDWSTRNFIEIIAEGDGDFEYSIDGINYVDSNYFENIPGGIYTAYVRDKDGCGMAKEEVFLVDYPKFFTPNNDGYSDRWQLQGFKEQPETIIFIFDRYGKLLKQLSSHSSGWDGTFNGNLMPADDYWFKVSLNGGREVSGHFSLIL